MSRFSTNQLMLSTSITATSGTFDISMRRKLSAELVLGDVTGSGTVGFSVSNNGTNFVTYNRMTTNVTDSITQTDIRVASVTLNTGTPSAVVFFPEGDHFRYLRTTFTVVTGAILTSAIGAAGSGYSINDVLTVADGTGGTVTVLTVDGGGAVLTYSLTTPGTGYSIAVHATSYGGAGTGFTLSVLTVDPGDVTVTLQDVD